MNASGIHHAASGTQVANASVKDFAGIILIPAPMSMQEIHPYKVFKTVHTVLSTALMCLRANGSGKDGSVSVGQASLSGLNSSWEGLILQRLQV